MSKIDKSNFGYLGLDYQYRLILQILTDNKFANNIVDIIQPNYFADEFLRIIVAEIKDAFEQDEVIPDVKSLEFRLMDRVSDEFKRDYTIAQIKKITESELRDSFKVQKMALNFCKQQAVQKSIKEIQKIIDRGQLEEYDKIEDILKKALEIGDNKDDGIDVFDNLEEVLSDDFRKPIPTGIKGLDEIMNGGLAKSELAIILAPFGVGKTTMITKIANHAKDLGKNVLQIFFEDNPKVIQRKHLCCWYNSEHDEHLYLNELSVYRDDLIELSKRKKKEKGILKLKKFPSDGTTIPRIRQYIRRLIAQGFKPDIILLDYIDCVAPSKQFKDSWDAEGNVMRQFETLLAEFNIAGWTAVQGNRSSIGANTVDSTMFGGSIKKGQIGHFVVSIAKTLEQKENGRANMAVLKSRFGKDGIVFEDVIFDNDRVIIEMTEQKGRTFLDNVEVKAKKDQNRVNFVLDAIHRNQVQQEE